MKVTSLLSNIPITEVVQQPTSSNEAGSEAGLATSGSHVSRQELETYLKWAMQQRRNDLQTYGMCGTSMYDLLKGRHDECKVICEHFGINV